MSMENSLTTLTEEQLQQFSEEELEFIYNKLDVQEKKFLQHKYKHNFEAYCKDLYNFDDFYAPLHQDLFDQIRNSEKKKHLILIPREHLKTSIFTIANTTHELLTGDINLRFLIGSSIWVNAKYMYGTMRRHFLSPRVREIWGRERTEMQHNSEEMRLINRPKWELREPSIGTTGVDHVLVSTHWDRIILDDPVTDISCQTEQGRIKTIDFLKYAMSLLMPDGVMVIIGTRYHHEDAYGWIINELGDLFNITVRKAVESGKVIFPSKFNKNRLRELQKIQQDYIFYCQYYNDPQPSSEKKFHKEDILTMKTKDFFKMNSDFYVCGDPINDLETKQKKDKAAIPVIAITEKNQIVIVNLIHERLAPYDFILSLFKFYKMYNPRATSVEMARGYRMLRPFIKQKEMELGINLRLKEPEANYNIPKEQRIRRLVPKVEANEFYILETCPYKDEIIRQFDLFPDISDDDIPDAISQVYDIADERPPKSRKEMNKFSDDDKFYGRSGRYNHEEDPTGFLGILGGRRAEVNW